MHVYAGEMLDQLLNCKQGFTCKASSSYCAQELSLRGCLRHHPSAYCQGSQRGRHHQVHPHVSPQRWHTQPVQIPEEQGSVLLLHKLHNVPHSVKIVYGVCCDVCAEGKEGVCVVNHCVWCASATGCRRGCSERWVSWRHHLEALWDVWEGGQILQLLRK